MFPVTMYCCGTLSVHVGLIVRCEMLVGAAPSPCGWQEVLHFCSL